MNALLQFADDVQNALQSNTPVVALESTIITHGMPYPQNLDTAQRLEDEVRQAGAVPATIAVMDGRIQIGLAQQKLEMLARSGDAMKLSRADLAVALSRRQTGATTVAATMIAARLAGIGVFATGGIGGVHRDVINTYDVSADLTELARTPVTVVCSGAKAILDIPKTLEMLETLGVPVIAYRQSNLPAFWSADSGIPAPLSMPEVADIGAFIQTREQLLAATEPSYGGVLVTNPIPPEHDIPAQQVSAWVEAALEDANRQQVRGKAVTPFLLQRVLEASNGKSLESNVELVCNNARLAAQLAATLSNPR